MGEVARFRWLSDWGRSVLLCGVSNPPAARIAASKIRPIVQSRELAGHVRFCSVGWTDKPLEASVFKGSATILPYLFFQLGPYIIFLPRCSLLHRLIDRRCYPGCRTGVICSIIFSRGNSNFAVRFTGSIARSGKPSTIIIYDVYLTSSHSPSNHSYEIKDRL